MCLEDQDWETLVYRVISEINSRDFEDKDVQGSERQLKKSKNFKGRIAMSLQVNEFSNTWKLAA